MAERVLTVTTVQFYRDFHGFTGGHLKVWEYFGHVRAAPGHWALVSFSPSSTWDGNPWAHVPEVCGLSQRPPDLHFVAGVDWAALDHHRRGADRPVINLVQHLRHADPSDVRYPYLARRAVRICVSDEVAAALAATGRVNGPVFTIPNGIGVPAGDSRERSERDIDTLVVANKAPALGRKIAARIAERGTALCLVDRLIGRDAFLRLLGRSLVTVFVPHQREGFYLPALEGMALGTLVVVPDCGGNRSFCHPGRNCVQADHTEHGFVQATHRARALGWPGHDRMVSEGKATAAHHSLEQERAAFRPILLDISDLWRHRRCVTSS